MYIATKIVISLKLVIIPFNLIFSSKTKMNMIRLLNVVLIVKWILILPHISLETVKHAMLRDFTRRTFRNICRKQLFE